MPTSSVNPIRVLVVQAGIGAAWLLGDPSRTGTPAYKPALQLAKHFALGCYPMRVWGGLLILIAVGLSVSLARRPRYAWHWSAALAMFWSFWVVMFTAGAFSNSGGIAPIFFAAGFAWYAFERATPPRHRKG